MNKDTSIKAFKEIKGTLGSLQNEIVKVLNQYGAMTGRELDSYLSHPGAWKRLSELKRMGKVIEIGKRPCKITGRLAYLWAFVPSDAQLRLL